MAETYLTPTFQNAAKPQAPAPAQTGANSPAAPNAPASAPAPAPAQTGGEQYQTDTFKKAMGDGQQQTIGGQQPPPAQQGWGIPQPVRDWSTVMSNEGLMNAPNLVGMRAATEAARARLGPEAAASADVVGNIVSPTTALNMVPYVGPELAGAAHEGIKSALTSVPGESWADYGKRVGEDTAGGFALGGIGHGAGALAPKVLPQLTQEGVKGGLTYLTHKVFGGLAGGDIMKEAIPLFGVYKGLDKVGEWAGEQAKNVASSPATQQAIRSLILSGGSALRQAAGPYDSWIPGQ